MQHSLQHGNNGQSLLHLSRMCWTSAFGEELLVGKFTFQKNASCLASLSPVDSSANSDCIHKLILTARASLYI